MTCERSFWHSLLKSFVLAEGKHSRRRQGRYPGMERRYRAMEQLEDRTMLSAEGNFFVAEAIGKAIVGNQGSSSSTEGTPEVKIAVWTAQWCTLIPDLCTDPSSHPDLSDLAAQSDVPPVLASPTSFGDAALPIVGTLAISTDPVAVVDYSNQCYFGSPPENCEIDGIGFNLQLPAVLVDLHLLTLEDVPFALELDHPTIVSEGPSHGTAAHLDDGRLAYTPNSNFHGSDSFVMSYDVPVGLDTQPFQVTVNVQVVSVNDAPVGASAFRSVNEDVTLNSSVSRSDPDGDDVSVQLVSAPSHASSFALNSNGTFSYRGETHFSGIDSFTYRVSDGELSSPTYTVTVSVTPIADVPMLNLQNASGFENSPIPLVISSGLVDTDGSETLSLSVSGVPAGVVLSKGTNLGGGLWSLTPAHLSGLTITSPDNQLFTLDVAATARETSNGHTATVQKSLHVVVNNVAPALVLDPVAAIDENGVATLTGTISDPGILDTFTLDIDWGDPLSPDNGETYSFPKSTTGSQSFTLTHQYLDDNPTATPFDTYSISATVTDDDGGSKSASTSVSVNNVAPALANVTINSPIHENDVATLSGEIVDLGTLDSFTLEVDWGDGSPVQSFSYPAGTTSFSESHQYLDDDPSGTDSDEYSVTATVMDDDGGTGSLAAVIGGGGPVASASGLTVTTTGNAAALAGALLGPGITLVSANYTGAPIAVGTFTGGLSAGIGIESGIILTSGNANLAPGPNNDDSATGSHFLPGDPDLGALIPGFTTFDASILELTFSSDTGNIFFNYVFASEEYNEFANSDFNDVFGFFLDGSNIALLPGTSTPVSINSVNGGNPFGVGASNPQFFNNNDLNDGGPFFNVQYDGFTTVLTAQFQGLAPGAHTLKLAIADAGDAAFDSAVFIEGGSLTDQPSAGTSIVVNNVAPGDVSLSLTAGSINEYGWTTLSGTFTDPGSLDTHEVEIDWGDGSTPTIINLSSGERSFTASHQFLDDDPSGTHSDVYSIDVTVTDDDQGVGTANTPVTVDNLPPVIESLIAPDFANKGIEGSPISISGAFSDIGTLDTHTSTVDWGDGSPTEPLALVQGSGSGAISGTHTYADGGLYTVTVTVEDDDGQTDMLTTVAVITGVGLDPDGTLEIVGTLGDDHVTVNRQGNGIIKVHADFLPTGEFKTFSAAAVDRIMAFLCEGDDHMNVSGNVGVPALIDGGGGNDHLSGGGDRALLIGGLGQDRLVGGSEDDALIGGSTTIDGNQAALRAALDAWADSDSYDDRVAALDGLLDVLADDEPDTLTGASGRDLFFDGLGDDLADLKTKGGDLETVL